MRHVGYAIRLGSMMRSAAEVELFAILQFRSARQTAVQIERRRNCSGQYVIPICGDSHEFNRFRGFNQSGSNRADMGASVVPACQKESSEMTGAVTRRLRSAWGTR